MPDQRRPPIVMFSLLVLIGLAGLFRVVQSPNHATYRTVDVVQLTGCGFCFGVALMGVICVLRGARTRDSK
jgi:cyanate permease